MIGLLQRVQWAAVRVADNEIARIDQGIAVFVGVQNGDREAQADRLLSRLLGYRIFPDRDDRMNRSLTDIGGGLLLVPQFTLAADTRKGMRPSFGPAAPPDEGERLFGYLCERARGRHPTVSTGRFGADMQVAFVNDGPVTFHLTASPA